MMITASLNLLKSQLNLDHDRDDALLAHKLAAAEAWIVKHTGCNGGTYSPDWSLNDPPADVIEAALQLAAYWYEQREAASFGVSMNAIPFGVYELLQSYREAVTGNDPS